jgi:two-component system NtrC family sensor kinase
MHKILFVDDEPNVLRSLRRLFMDEDDYELMFANSAVEGLELLAEEGGACVVVSDYRMPDMNGVEFLSKVHDQWPDSIRIVLSGYADTAAVVEAIKIGHIYRFIPKPWNDDELLVNIANAIDTYELSRNNERLSRELEQRNQDLEHMNASLEEQVEQRTEALALRSEVLQMAQDILDSMPVAVLGVDIEDQIVQANVAATRLLKPRGLLLGEKTSEVLDGGILAFLEQVKLAGESRDVVIINNRRYEASGQYLNNDRTRGVVMTLVGLGED